MTRTPSKSFLVLIALLVLDLLLWILIFSAPQVNAESELYFLNIGQGDSSLIRLPNNVKVLIDGGPNTDALVQNLEKALGSQDKYIDLVVMTHPQLDHFGGFLTMLKQYRVGAFVSGGRKGEIPEYGELMRQLSTHSIPYVALSEGDTIQYGEIVLQVLAPNATESQSGELNDTGLVILGNFKNFKALYTADTGFSTEERLTREYDVNVDVLKVGHHGSRFSSGEMFLAEATPAVSVVEVGKNTYGHPTQETFRRLAAHSNQVLRTDKEGIIKIDFSDGSLKVLHK